jgi:carboxymethylenebutenolidase
MGKQGVTGKLNGGVSGYLIEPETPGPHPGLIIIHEWWGLNDHIKDIAGRFAAEGFVALAPDLYDGVVTKDAGKAGDLMQSLDQSKALAKLNGAVDYLTTLPGVEHDKIGVTGFCMGGTYALLLPCHNRKIKAAAPFYGDVPPDEVLKELSAPVLFIGADQDQWITLDKIKRLSDGLARFGKKGQVKVYNGVGHAFFNDTRPEAHNKAAASDAWRRVVDFLRANL